MKNRNKIISLILVLSILIILPLNSMAAVSAPSVTTNAPKGVKYNSAIVGGNVQSDKGSPIIERGFVYSTDSTFTTGATKVIVSGTLGKYRFKLLNLNSNTTYYYKAYAINSAGISYGTVKSFKTKLDTIPPTIIGSTLHSDNSYIDVTMSEWVYGSDKTALTLGKFQWTFLSNGGTATASVSSVTRTDGTSLLGGESVLRFWLNITGTPSGIETIQIWPLDGMSVYDSSNNAMAATESTGSKHLNDKLSPKIISGSLSPDNSYMDITMSQGVYKIGGLPLTATQFSATFIKNIGTATGASITGVSNTSGNPLIGGETILRVYLTISGTSSGDEFVSIGPLNGTSIYDINGNPMSIDQSTGPKSLNDLLSPAISSAKLATDNSYVDVTFTQGIYDPGNRPLSKDSLKVLFTRNGGNSSSSTISNVTNSNGTLLIGGETSIRVHLIYNGIPSGTETIEVMPFDASSIFDDNDNPMAASQTTGILKLYDKLPPSIVGGIVSPDNRYIDITTSEGIYKSGGGAISSSNLILTFAQNLGTATSASISSIARTDGNSLVGGETQFRVYLSITGTPSGTETISISPSTATSIYDKANNAMNISQTTGAKNLICKTPIKRLVHSVKSANSYYSGNADTTFITGDYVPLSIKLDIISSLVNPVIVANLNSSNPNFCLKEIKNSSGTIDTKSVSVYKNGIKLAASSISIIKQVTANTLNITVNDSFVNGDVLEVVYFTKLGLTDAALKSKIRPTYGVIVGFPCYVMWGSLPSYYAQEHPGPAGTDQFNTYIVVVNPYYLQ